MAIKKLVVISSYPEKGFTHGRKTVGVASYTKNTLLGIKDLNKNLKIVVLSEIFDQPENYSEKGITIKRVWKRGRVFDVFKIFNQAQREKTKHIFLTFEAYMFGGLIKAILLIPTLVIFKLTRKKVYLALHQVIQDFESIEKNKLKSLTMNLFKTIFFQLLVILSFKIIVFEKRFKQILGNQKKIVVIPHAVEEERVIDRKRARKKLGLIENEFYVLYFGFLSPYKGVDLLTKLWKRIKGGKLILAGGGNPNHMGNPNYSGFVHKTIKEAREAGIIAPGFIPEEQRPLYFSAADLFILPYQMFMSSSGPLSMAFGFKKPVLLSRQSAGYFETDDMKEALKQAGLKPLDVIFDFDLNNLNQKLKWVRKNMSKLRKFSLLMSEKRNWKNIGKMYLRVLNE